MDKLIVLEPGTTEFEANGVKYFVEKTISIERFEAFQILEIEAAYGVSYRSLYDTHVRLKQHLNKLEFAEAAVLNNNVITGMYDVMKNQVYHLKFCTLFINTIDEDRRYITEAQMNEKINNWKHGGLDITFFILLSVGFINGFTQNYNSHLANTLNQE